MLSTMSQDPSIFLQKTEFHCPMWLNDTAYYIFFFYYSIDENLSCSCMLTTVNCALINMSIQASLEYAGIKCFQEIAKNNITEWKGSYIFIVLRILHADFHSNSTNLRFQQKHRRVPLSPSSPAFKFLMITIQTGMG